MHCEPEKLYDWDRGAHTHDYCVKTSKNEGHCHLMEGKTSAAGGERGHVHDYAGMTTYDEGHVHHYCGTTGPAVYLPDGSHTHCMEGTTTCDYGHSHDYQGNTCRGK
ncbi:hypothetical protein GJ688_15275 [Heliobacillus mobilis]|uniref:YmaF family protein n=1 Tax=Heliobacterium mobile TaxID=28064 RepID=A0A6I3SMV9_HELMO|nr:YmaF family protein [Heliobacterium mobile]MTV50331.1 hypothetical protein [Heliobacterium mobile]